MTDRAGMNLSRCLTILAIASLIPGCGDYPNLQPYKLLNRSGVKYEVGQTVDVVAVYKVGANLAEGDSDLGYSVSAVGASVVTGSTSTFRFYSDENCKSEVQDRKKGRYACTGTAEQGGNDPLNPATEQALASLSLKIESPTFSIVVKSKYSEDGFQVTSK